MIYLVKKGWTFMLNNHRKELPQASNDPAPVEQALIMHECEWFE